MTEQEIIEKVNAFIARKAGVEASAIRPDTDMEDDLHIDYIQRLELAVELEQELPITIPGHEAVEMFYVQQWYDLVDRNMNTD